LSLGRRRISLTGSSDPHLIWRTWRSTSGEDLPGREFLAIPVENLAGLPAAVFRRQYSRTGEDLDPREITAFRIERYREMRQLPQASLAWLGRLHTAGRRGGWWANTPHILVRGNVGLGGSRVLDWRAENMG
jgi:hypothetical protein